MNGNQERSGSIKVKYATNRMGVFTSNYSSNDK